jgi:hypothetical protein
MVSIFYFAHLHGQDATTSVALLESEELIRSKFSKLIVILISFWLTLQIVFYTLMLLNVFPEAWVTWEILAFSFFLPIATIVIMLYLTIKYSGIPARSSEWSEKLKHVTLVTLVWCITRLSMTVFNVAVFRPSEAAAMIANFREKG